MPERLIPGGILLVLLGDEEPDELGIAHPAFPLHGIAPGNKRETETFTFGAATNGEVISSSLCVFMCARSHVPSDGP